MYDPHVRVSLSLTWIWGTMESITKNRQSSATLRAMIERAYGRGQVPTGNDFAEELGHGWFNVAYRIRLGDGTEAVLKIAPPPHIEVMSYERGAMATELAALALIREHTTVPVPAVDFADRSHELCDADWFFMPLIDADNFGIVKDTLSPAERNAYTRRSARRPVNLTRSAAPRSAP
jgi:hypothetical protein